jgi:hypothetical protein
VRALLDPTSGVDRGGGVLDPRVDAQHVALIPECAECDRPWLPADEERWQAYHTDDEPPELAFYCSSCAEREFGDP